ncbi:MAG: SIMPL domain-containing protein [Candidatus Woesearchaeota archaeon]
MVEENKVYYILSLFVLALILVSAVLVFKLAMQKPIINIENNPSQEANSITVTGESEIEVMPDKAVIYVSVVTENITAKEAKDSAAEIFSRVKSALIRAGVKQDMIESSSYSITPIYEWNDIFKRSDFKGYRVTHTMKITTTDIDKAGDIIDAAVNAGANEVEQVSFELSPELERKVYADALEDAAALAKAKASSIANALGAQLGSIKTVSESSSYYYPYTPYYSKAMVSEGAASTQIATQKLRVTGRVSVSYYIK